MEDLKLRGSFDISDKDKRGTRHVMKVLVHYEDTDFSGFVYHANYCLLYTSDAADEEDSVDFGGRRIIKETTNKTQLRIET